MILQEPHAGYIEPTTRKAAQHYPGYAEAAHWHQRQSHLSYLQHSFQNQSQPSVRYIEPGLGRQALPHAGYIEPAAEKQGFVANDYSLRRFFLMLIVFPCVSSFYFDSNAYKVVICPQSWWVQWSRQPGICLCER